MLSKKKHFKTIYYLLILILLQCCSSDDSNNLVEKDTTPPSINSFTINNVSGNNINTPILISTTLELDIDITDDLGVTTIEIFIDAIKVANNTTPPFNFSIDVSQYNSGNHSVRIKAYDAAGNFSSTKDIAIIIDNTLPAITNVSIRNESILAGNINILSFKVSDDKDISSVAISVDNVTIATITDKNYNVNIATSNLNDGRHNIEIIASDSNNKIAKLTISFIADNTGPKITIDAINEGETISEIIQFEPKLSDEFSEINSLEVLYRNERIHFFENGAITAFSFNPDDYTSGDGRFTFIAKDALDNVSELSINTKTTQVLIRLKIPQDYLSTNIMKSWVFASKSDGSPISIVKIESGMTDIVLYATEKIDDSENFMITFYEIENSGFNRISTIQNLTITSPGTLHLAPRNTFSEESETSYTMNGFSANDIVKSQGVDYKGIKANDRFKLTLMRPQKTNQIYFYTYDNNAPETSYRYQFLNRPIGNSFALNSTAFGDQNVVLNNFVLQSYFPEVDLQPILSIFGYTNQNDYSNNVYHELFNSALTSKNTDINSSISYPLHTTFETYKHRLVSKDYITERKGIPLTNYSKPNWDIDYDTSSGNTIKIVTSGTTHSVGRLWLKNEYSIEPYYDYSWTLVYDSQKNKSEVIIPKFPDELSDLNFYKFSLDLFWQTEQLELSRYQNISNYNDYVNKVLKNNVNYDKVSDFVESLYHVPDFRKYPVFLKDVFN
ncbi:hypothetical protein ATE84_4020 [Aquimarina sp. MAR_2010_214]|uniref:Ig-like domain-containing protein n=1 Tax=Aquimarina sp. MAR_2010_214 TaxID=1250026 RepID=UPI000C70D59F|nr:Ig-like domain-containing protein [Aquimarina sp. MAR_2010_214]PKV51920.1 hypothetical protein ATE84_4020 [Aquimarina sp. MAR_2010_214]